MFILSALSIDLLHSSFSCPYFHAMSVFRLLVSPVKPLSWYFILLTGFVSLRQLITLRFLFFHSNPHFVAFYGFARRSRFWRSHRPAARCEAPSHIRETMSNHTLTQTNEFRDLALKTSAVISAMQTPIRSSVARSKSVVSRKTNP